MLSLSCDPREGGERGCPVTQEEGGCHREGRALSCPSLQSNGRRLARRQEVGGALLSFRRGSGRALLAVRRSYCHSQRKWEGPAVLRSEVGGLCCHSGVKWAGSAVIPGVGGRSCSIMKGGGRIEGSVWVRLSYTV